MLASCHIHQGLTITLQSLPCKAPEERAAVLTESWTLVVVDFEAVRHVNLESLFMELQEKRHVGNSLLSTSSLRGNPNLYHRRWDVYCPFILGYDHQEETITIIQICKAKVLYIITAVRWELRDFLPVLIYLTRELLASQLHANVFCHESLLGRAYLSSFST